MVADMLQSSLTGELEGEAAAAFDAARERGNAYFRDGDYDSALRAYNEAEIINPLSPIPPGNRALVYLKQEQWQQSREQSAIALQILEEVTGPSGQNDQWRDNLKVKLLLRRSTACAKLHLFQLAADDLAQVLHLQPDNHVAKDTLDDLRRRHGVIPMSVSRNIGQTTSSEGPRIRELAERVHRTENTKPNGNSSRLPTMSKPQDDPEQHQLRRLDTKILKELAESVFSKPPKSAAEFEHGWRTLRSLDSGDARDVRSSHYLIRTIGSDTVRRGLLGENLTPQMLVEIGKALYVAVKLRQNMDDGCNSQNEELANEEEIEDFLQALVQTPRFHLLILFFSREEKCIFQHLIDALASSANADDGVISALRTSFALDC